MEFEAPDKTEWIKKKSFVNQVRLPQRIVSKPGKNSVKLSNPSNLGLAHPWGDSWLATHRSVDQSKTFLRWRIHKKKQSLQEKLKQGPEPGGNKKNWSEI